MTDIGIMGGAFSPIHNWHLTLADWARFRFSLKHVYFVPSGTPPHKKNVLDKEVRFEMVEAAVKGHPHFIASRLEVDRPGVSWTIDTLKALKEQLGDGVRLNFIMGDDNIKSMVRYERRAEFQKLARLLVSPRGKADPSLVTGWREQLPDGEIELLDCPASTLSSTDVRTWIENGEPYRYAVPEAVYNIIEERGLYRVEKASSGCSTDTAPVADSNSAKAADSDAPVEAESPTAKAADSNPAA